MVTKYFKKTVVLIVLVFIVSITEQNSHMEDNDPSYDIQGIIEEAHAMFPDENHYSVSRQFIEQIEGMEEEELAELLELSDAMTLLWDAMLGADGYDYLCTAYAENGETFDVLLDWTDAAVTEADTQKEEILSQGLESVCGPSANQIYRVSSKPTLISSVSIYVRNYDPSMGNAVMVLDLPGNRQFIPGSKVALVLGLSTSYQTTDLQVFEGQVCDDHSVEVEITATTLNKLSFKSTLLSVFI